MSPAPSIRSWFRSSKVRRSIAVCAVVLAGGGLILYRSPGGSGNAGAATPIAVTPDGPTQASFTGPGAHGTLSLSHGRLLAGGTRTMYAELVLKADAAEQAKERAPLSLAVVLDTSGSMSGDKIAQAKRSVLDLIAQMSDTDEIALVRYDTEATLLQPLRRVGEVRSDLVARVQSIEAGGGTNIPGGLQSGLSQLVEATKGRVRRVVLVSDGLDHTRQNAEALAKSSAEKGITISSLGVGLDFDEAYMGAVSRAGRGNFAFVENADALATFLRRELKEAASTTIENATVTLALPPSMRVVRAVGATVDARFGGTALSVGSLFAGDERRIVVEIEADMSGADARQIASNIRWDRVGGSGANIDVAALTVVPTSDPQQVEEARNAAVVASAVSALASVRQLEAVEAYSRGDGGRARLLIDQNMKDLAAAEAAAPPAAAAALQRQREVYQGTQSSFATAAPTSTQGKAAAKRAAEKDLANNERNAF